MPRSELRRQPHHCVSRHPTHQRDDSEGDAHVWEHVLSELFSPIDDCVAHRCPPLLAARSPPSRFSPSSEAPPDGFESLRG
jgi:hypothetical protein